MITQTYPISSQFLVAFVRNCDFCRISIFGRSYWISTFLLQLLQVDKSFWGVFFVRYIIMLILCLIWEELLVRGYELFCWILKWFFARSLRSLTKIDQILVWILKFRRNCLTLEQFLVRSLRDMMFFLHILRGEIGGLRLNHGSRRNNSWFWNFVVRLETAAYILLWLIVTKFDVSWRIINFDSLRFLLQQLLRRLLYFSAILLRSFNWPIRIVQ